MRLQPFSKGAPVAPSIVRGIVNSLEALGNGGAQ